MTNKFSLYLHWGNISSLSMFSCFRDTLHHSHYNGRRLLLYVRCQPGVVITNGTNRIVIVPKAFGTLNHHSYGHIPILTMMTWFRGLVLNDSFLVRLAITFHIIVFRMTFLAVTTVANVATVTIIHLTLRPLDKPFLFLVNRSKSSCFLLNACQLLTLPERLGKC